ncbi:hypothetical protein F5X99DRAFT_392289 [Biscogniauxia marginata]|nr:hypothetical protein F5X99DRAFT_392289 [Biscogniauxia marginata]
METQMVSYHRLTAIRKKTTLSSLIPADCNIPKNQNAISSSLVYQLSHASFEATRPFRALEEKFVTTKWVPRWSGWSRYITGHWLVLELANILLSGKQNRLSQSYPPPPDWLRVIRQQISWKSLRACPIERNKLNVYFQFLDEHRFDGFPKMQDFSTINAIESTLVPELPGTGARNSPSSDRLPSMLEEVTVSSGLFPFVGSCSESCDKALEVDGSRFGSKEGEAAKLPVTDQLVVEERDLLTNISLRAELLLKDTNGIAPFQVLKSPTRHTDNRGAQAEWTITCACAPHNIHPRRLLEDLEPPTPGSISPCTSEFAIRDITTQDESMSDTKLVDSGIESDFEDNEDIDEYWTWDGASQRFFHVDEDTGETVYFPDEL